jgi:hypothetical protein
MYSKVLFYFYLISAVSNAAKSAEKDVVILECPYGWIASGQAWYAPKKDGDQWDSTQPAHVGQTLYTTSFHLQGRDIYFPDKYAICLICEYNSAIYHPDKTRLYFPGHSQRWVEVCAYRSSFMRTEKLKFEKQICEVIYDGQGKAHFYTFENTLIWCRSQPVCAVEVNLSMTYLHDALRTTSFVSCSGNNAM